MNLGDLLSELRQNILHDRSNLTSGDSDLLWSDATLVRYINEAHRRFARRSFCIRDNSNEDVTVVTLVEGQTEYALHPSVMAVMSARLTGDVTDMIRAGHTAFEVRRTPDHILWDPAAVILLPPGKPIAFSTDEAIALDDFDSASLVTLRVYPAPSAEYNGVKIRLRVVREPINDFNVNALHMVPEIPAAHHLEMLDWAAYLALRIVDRDGGDPARAKEFASSFESHVQAARSAALRKLFAPQQWGFGRTGWSWYNG